MFEKGEYVICGNNGICCVMDITTLHIPGVDQKELIICCGLCISPPAPYMFP